MVEKVGSTQADENSTGGTRKKKNGPPLKVVVRRLPPSMTGEDLLHQLAPLPTYEYFYLAAADYSLSPWSYARAYFQFKTIEDVVSFKDRFDGYVFVDGKGSEYPVLVEIAPSQNIPKTGPENAGEDAKCGTIEKTPEYQKFLEDLEKEEEEPVPSIEQRLQEVEQMKKEKRSLQNKPTHLIEFLLEENERRIQRREERRIRQEEERKKRLEERKRAEERDRKRREREEKERKEREKEAKLNEEKQSVKSSNRRSDVAPRFSKTKERDDYDYKERDYERRDETRAYNSRDKATSHRKDYGSYDKKGADKKYDKDEYYEKEYKKGGASKYNDDYYGNRKTGSKPRSEREEPQKSSRYSSRREEEKQRKLEPNEKSEVKSSRRSEKPTDSHQEKGREREKDLPPRSSKTSNSKAENKDGDSYREDSRPSSSRDTADKSRKDRSQRSERTETERKPPREGTADKKRSAKPAIQIYQPGAARRRQKEQQGEGNKDETAKDEEK